MHSPSVQLYTLRDAIAADLSGTIARVREIGYELVEPYAFDQRTTELADALHAAGVTAPSAHVAIIDAVDHAPIFDAAELLGIETVIDPFIPTDRWQTADEAKRIADRVNELSAAASDRGLRFGYHNHQWEFTNTVDGRPIYDLFVELLEPAVVLEVDTFWSTVGAADTPSLLRSLGNRVAAIHVKDGRISGDIATALPSSESALIVPEALQRAFEHQTPAGQGDIDVAAILHAAPNALRVVEFDAYAGDLFTGISESLTWLRDHDK